MPTSYCLLAPGPVGGVAQPSEGAGRSPPSPWGSAGTGTVQTQFPCAFRPRAGRQGGHTIEAVASAARKRKES